jgi:segregation and condensation protein A
MSQPESVSVHLDVFEGPLDLLLYLIRKNNLDIYDVPISEITKEYLSYLDIMKDLNLDVAGEFLVMASTLMQIKAKMLLPSHSEEEEGDEGPNPWADLADKISEYEKFKNAAKFLDGQFEQNKDIFYRGSPRFSDSEKMLNVEFFELLDAVKRALEKVDDKGSVIAREEFKIEDKIEKILSMVMDREWVLLDDVFSSETKKAAVITCFLALLELMKTRRVFVMQDKIAGEVRIYKQSEVGLPDGENSTWPQAESGENLQN